MQKFDHVCLRDALLALESDPRQPHLFVMRIAKGFRDLEAKVRDLEVQARDRDVARTSESQLVGKKHGWQKTEATYERA